MNKSGLRNIFYLFCLGLALISASCVQSGNPQPASAPKVPAYSHPAKYTSFEMGGMKIKVQVPAAYVDAPANLRQSVHMSFFPPQNVFVVFIPSADKTAVKGSGLKVLQNHKLFAVSARPEFMKEALDQNFFNALARDFKRVNGKFSPERLGQFKVLTEDYYASDDAFTHSLGVYDSKKNSLSIVNIVRQAGSLKQGAVSAYPAGGSKSLEGVSQQMLQGWDKKYFSGAYHYVLIRNVVRINTRCLNIYFFAPLASEADINAAMQENKAFMDAFMPN